MALLQVKDLVKYFGAVSIIKDLTFEINHGEKWGLIGRNGCGKTTLINILTGIEDYDRGEISWAQNAKIGYLSQQPAFKGDVTLYQELRSIFRDLDQLQNRIQDLQQKMDYPDLDKTELDKLIHEFHELNEEFEHQGGYQIEGRIQGVLRGLGFSKERWNDSAILLSGGEQTKLALARLLLMDYEMLFLDEPTNYLDLAAIEWLESFLADFRGAVLLVSHDRHFLDRVVKGFFEIEFGGIKRYKGNYSEYRQQKLFNYQTQLKTYEKQEKVLAKQEKFVREARATEKSKRKAHSIEKRMAKQERIDKPVQYDKSIKLEFTGFQKSARKVLEVTGVSKKFGEKVILNDIQFLLESGEKVALIGPNGTGKTTLLKIILGLEPPDRGDLRLGYEVYPGYFSQIEKEADLTGTPFSQIMSVADFDNTEARTILGRFLFSGEDVFKEVRDLSGGERRRLGLIKLMLSKANFLILDEPTNHLDLDSIEVIEEALHEYNGSLLVVSHDRYFINKVVDRYLALIDGQLFSFIDYQDYLSWQAEKAEAGSIEASKPKSEAQSRRENTKEIQKQLRRRQRLLEEVETEIDRIEKRRNELSEALNNPEINADYLKSMELSKELNELDLTLNDLLQQWEQLHLELTEYENLDTM